MGMGVVPAPSIVGVLVPKSELVKLCLYMFRFLEMETKRSCPQFLATVCLMCLCHDVRSLHWREAQDLRTEVTVAVKHAQTLPLCCKLSAPILRCPNR